MSGWVRATETRSGEIALSLERMSVIEAIDPVNRTATVQAGVVLETLETELARHGLTFPLDLGGRGSCQLGGNASTNAGGMRVIRYGMMREQVLGVEAVLADGRVISSLNQMIKNNTGYRSEEHTSELQSLMRISYAVFCLKKKNTRHSQAS